MSAEAESLQSLLSVVGALGARISDTEMQIKTLQDLVRREGEHLRSVRERVDVEIRREDGFESDIEARMDKVESNAMAAEKRARGAETAVSLASQASVRVLEKLSANMDHQLEVLMTLKETVEANRIAFLEHDAVEREDRRMMIERLSKLRPI
jgi:hypothetical protein